MKITLKCPCNRNIKIYLWDTKGAFTLYPGEEITLSVSDINKIEYIP